jgi:hypothetical protein
MLGPLGETFEAVIHRTHTNSKRNLAVLQVLRVRMQNLRLTYRVRSASGRCEAVIDPLACV